MDEAEIFRFRLLWETEAPTLEPGIFGNIWFRQACTILSGLTESVESYSHLDFGIVSRAILALLIPEALKRGMQINYPGTRIIRAINDPDRNLKKLYS